MSLMITLCQTSYSTLAFRRQAHNSSVNMQELWPHTFHVVFIAGYSLDGDALLSCCDMYIMMLIVIRDTGDNPTRVQFRNSCLKLLLLDENLDYQTSWRHQYPVIRTSRKIDSTRGLAHRSSETLTQGIDLKRYIAGIRAIKG